MSMIADFQCLMQATDEAPVLPRPPRLQAAAASAGPEPGFAALIRKAHAALIEELIARIHAQRPEFFEDLVLDVLVAMGYGNGKRDFAGSLEARHAGKGVFVTTTHFSPGAGEFCAQLSRRVVLIDGCQLADLMVHHDIGVKVKDSFVLKRIDPDYFSIPPASRIEDTIPASSQPRR